MNAFSKFESRRSPEPSLDDFGDERWRGWRLIAIWAVVVTVPWLILYGIGRAIFEIVLAVSP